MKPVLILFSTLWFTNVDSQQSFNSGGGDMKSSNGNYSYSIGQCFYSYIKDSNNTITTGVQQTYEIKLLSSANNSSLGQFKLYPNPTNGLLYFETNTFIENNVSIIIYDIEGRLVNKISIDSPSVKIDLKECSAGIYFIRVTNLIKELANYKIAKL